MMKKRKTGCKIIASLLIYSSLFSSLEGTLTCWHKAYAIGSDNSYKNKNTVEVSEENIVHFTDAGFENRVKKILGIYDRPLVKQDCDEVKRLWFLEEDNIQTFEDLKHFKKIDSILISFIDLEETDFFEQIEKIETKFGLEIIGFEIDNINLILNLKNKENITTLKIQGDGFFNKNGIKGISGIATLKSMSEFSIFGSSMEDLNNIEFPFDMIRLSAIISGLKDVKSLTNFLWSSIDLRYNRDLDMNKKHYLKWIRRLYRDCKYSTPIVDIEGTKFYKKYKGTAIGFNTELHEMIIKSNLSINHDEQVTLADIINQPEFIIDWNIIKDYSHDQQIKAYKRLLANNNIPAINFTGHKGALEDLFNSYEFKNTKVYMLFTEEQIQYLNKNILNKENISALLPPSENEVGFRVPINQYLEIIKKYDDEIDQRNAFIELEKKYNKNFLSDENEKKLAGATLKQPVYLMEDMGFNPDEYIYLNTNNHCSYFKNLETGEITKVDAIQELKPLDIKDNKKDKNLSDEFLKLSPKNNIGKDKIWTVKFNKPIMVNSITYENIYVTDKNNKKVELKLYNTDKKSISIAPVSNYKEGATYTLWIKDIQTEDGKNLNKNIQIDFIIKN